MVRFSTSAQGINGNIVRLGTDTGIKIQINRSQFTNMRFCKGMLVYRAGPNLQSPGLLDYQAESKVVKSCVDCGIFITQSVFTQCNYRKLLQSLRPLYDYKRGTRQAQRIDSSGLLAGSVMVPIFQNYGAIINIQDFQGPVIIQENSFQKNTINIRDLQFGYQISSPTDVKNNLVGYLNLANNNYQMVRCSGSTVQGMLMVDGISQEDQDALFMKFEHQAIILISRSAKKILLQQNTFEQNIALFGGAVTITSPNFKQAVDFVTLVSNVFRDNMAYISGNAVYVRMTKTDQSRNNICGGITIQDDKYLSNFGTKVTFGTVSLICDSVQTGQNFADEDATSDWSTTNQAQSTASQIRNTEFIGNYVGSRGSALHLKGISLYVYGCTFTKNGAVDSYTETQVQPAYTKLVAGQYGSYNQPFTYKRTECGDNEYQDLWNCFGQPTKQSFGEQVFESRVQGAIYYQGQNNMQKQQSQSKFEEVLEIVQSTFTSNHVGFPFFAGDLASCIYAVNPKLINLDAVVFKEHTSGFTVSFMLKAQRSLYDYYPPEYFNSAKAPIVQVKYDSHSSSQEQQRVFVKGCEWNDNNHYQAMTSQQGESAQIYDASLLSIESSAKVQPIVIIENIKVQRNRVIGDNVSLFAFKNIEVDIKSSLFEKNGQLSASRFTSQSSHSQLARLVSQSLSQARGIITAVNCLHLLSQANKFKFNAAESGTAYTIRDTPFTAKLNAYEWHVATKGSVALITGTGRFKSAHWTETISYALGTAYVLISDDNQRLNMHAFREINVQNCVDENVSLFYLERVGGFILRNSLITQQYTDNTIIRLFKTQDNTVGWNQAYLDTRLVKGVNAQAGTLWAVDSYYEGYDGSLASLDVVIDGVKYPVLPDNTNNRYLWIVNNKISNQVGGLAGVISASNSHIYLSTTDGSYQSPSSQGNFFGGRRLEASAFFINKNKGYAGAGVLNAVQDSVIVLKGAYFDANEGIMGGCIMLISSSLRVTLSQMSNNKALKAGGVIYSANSLVNLDKSLVEKNFAVKSSVLYLIGFYDEQPSKIGDVYILANQATLNTISITDSSVEFKKTYFQNNLSIGGSNGITAVGSLIKATGIQAIQTTQQPPSQVTVDSGFIMLSYSSTLELVQSRITQCQGLSAGAIYSLGQSTLKVTSSQFIKNTVLNGAIISIQSGRVTELTNVVLDENEGGAMISIFQSELLMKDSQLINTKSQLVHAVHALININSTRFISGGDSTKLGGAIYCECYGMHLQYNYFRANEAVAGGALYLVGMADSGISRRISTKTPSTFMVAESYFELNKAQQGGAIIIVTVNEVLLTKNYFQKNQARQFANSVASSTLLSSKAMGGAIYSLCDPVYKLDCQVTITDNTFDNNTASDWGNSIIYLNREPTYSLDLPNTFLNSQGLDYQSTNLELSLALIQETASNNDPSLNQTQQRIAINQTRFDVVSGQQLSLEFGVYAESIKGTPILYMNENHASAQFKVVGSNETERSEIQIVGDIQIAKSGIFNFTGLTFIAEPGIRFRVELQFNQTSDIQSGNSRTYTFLVNTRKCVKGEALTIDNKCLQCPFGSYSLVSMDSVGNCTVCEQGSTCYGGDVIAPIANYWRPHIDQAIFLPCLNQQACLAGNSTHQMGKCGEGYEGTLCSNCEAGYYSDYAGHICTGCPNRPSSIYQLSFIGTSSILIFSIVITMIVNVNWLFAATAEPNQLPVLFKVIFGHLQMVWFFSKISALSTEKNQIMSVLLSTQLWLLNIVDHNSVCLLRAWTEHWESLIKIGFYLGPVILWLTSLLVMYLSSRVLKHPKGVFKYQIISSFFLIYQILCLYAYFTAFSVVNCVELMGRRVMVDNRDVACSDGGLYQEQLVPAIIAIVFWMFLVPLMKLLMFCQDRDKRARLKNAEQRTDGLTEAEIQELQWTNVKYTVDVNGYKKERTYWDFIQLLQMVSMALAYTLMNQFMGDQIATLLTLIIFLLGFMVLELMASPFLSISLNVVKQLSQVAIIGLILSEICESQAVFKGQRVIADLLIIVPHLGFYLFMFLEMKKLIYFKSTKQSKQVSFGMIHFEINLKNRELFDTKYGLVQQKQPVASENPREHVSDDAEQLDTSRPLFEQNFGVRADEILIKMQMSEVDEDQVNTTNQTGLVQEQNKKDLNDRFVPFEDTHRLSNLRQDKNAIMRVADEAVVIRSTLTDENRYDHCESQNNKTLRNKNQVESFYGNEDIASPEKREPLREVQINRHSIVNQLRPPSLVKSAISESSLPRFGAKDDSQEQQFGQLEMRSIPASLDSSMVSRIYQSENVVTRTLVEENRDADTGVSRRSDLSENVGESPKKNANQSNIRCSEQLKKTDRRRLL